MYSNRREEDNKLVSCQSCGYKQSVRKPTCKNCLVVIKPRRQVEYPNFYKEPGEPSFTMDAKPLTTMQYKQRHRKQPQRQSQQRQSQRRLDDTTCCGSKKQSGDQLEPKVYKKNDFHHYKDKDQDYDETFKDNRYDNLELEQKSMDYSKRNKQMKPYRDNDAGLYQDQSHHTKQKMAHHDGKQSHSKDHHSKHEKSQKDWKSHDNNKMKSHHSQQQHGHHKKSDSHYRKSKPYYSESESYEDESGSYENDFDSDSDSDSYSYLSQSKRYQNNLEKGKTPKYDEKGPTLQPTNPPPNSPKDHSGAWQQTKEEWEGLKMHHDKSSKTHLYAVGDPYTPMYKEEVLPRLESITAEKPLSSTQKVYAKDFTAILSKTTASSEVKGDDFEDLNNTSESDSDDEKGTITTQSMFKNNQEPWFIETFKNHTLYTLDMTLHKNFVSLALMKDLIDSVGTLEIRFSPLLKPLGRKVVLCIKQESFDPKNVSYVSGPIGSTHMILGLKFSEKNSYLDSIWISVKNKIPLTSSNAKKTASQSAAAATTPSMSTNQGGNVKSQQSWRTQVFNGMSVPQDEMLPTKETIIQALYPTEGGFKVVESSLKAYDMWNRIFRTKYTTREVEGETIEFLTNLLHPRDSDFDDFVLGHSLTFMGRTFNASGKRLEKVPLKLFPYALGKMALPIRLFNPSSIHSDTRDYDCFLFLSLPDAEPTDKDYDNGLTINTVEDKRRNEKLTQATYARSITLTPNEDPDEDAENKPGALVIEGEPAFKKSALYVKLKRGDMKLDFKLPKPEENKWFPETWTGSKVQVKDLSSVTVGKMNRYLGALRKLDDQHIVFHTNISNESLDFKKSDSVVFLTFMKEYDGNNKFTGKYSLTQMLECRPSAPSKVEKLEPPKMPSNEAQPGNSTVGISPKTPSKLYKGTK